ncbi:hypothetical protein K438DRAFT_1767894 [Mycena galopus ATCC 62051]|nr:hypothetical protein K438DRAFT_1767894 [Mycena galopus ATCC 62051]
MAPHRVCEIPFDPNPENYKNDREYDTNPRKHWYLILGVGLFTKKTDTDDHAAPHDILIFFKKSHAVRRWRGRCMRRHTEDDHSNPRDSTDPDDGEDDSDADAESIVPDCLPRAQSAARSIPRSTCSVPRAASATPGRVRPVISTTPLVRTPSAAKRCREANASVVPIDRAVKIKYELSTPVQLRRDMSVTKRERQVSVKHETLTSPGTKLSLYADISDSELTDDLFASDPAPQPLSDLEEDQGDVMMPPASPVPAPPPISTTVSTVSSLSSDSLVGESISGARPAALRMRAAGPTTAHASTASTGSSSYHMKTVPRPAFAEVRPGESLQVIGQEEVVEYCAGQSARLGT